MRVTSVVALEADEKELKLLLLLPVDELNLLSSEIVLRPILPLLYYRCYDVVVIVVIEHDNS